MELFKMSQLDSFLYLPVEIPPPRNIDIDQLDQVRYEDMLRDDYRNCYHIPLLTSNLEGTDFLQSFPGIKGWLENEVFSILKGRVMIIVTPPGEENPPHIDCSPNKFDTVQHKFRYVIRGHVSDLVFVSKHGEMRPCELKKPFIMEGKWPHYMKNSSNKRKYTLAVGSPWEPDFTKPRYVELLERSLKVNHEFKIAQPDPEALPEGWEKLFQDKYLL
jgi:hypothetical protein